jgi:hypothetical protein
VVRLCVTKYKLISQHVSYVMISKMKTWKDIWLLSKKGH